MGAAALRLAALTHAEPLERAVAAAVLAMVLVVAETLALGLLGLSSSSVALGLAAIATFFAAHALTPAPAITIRAAAATAWHAAGGVARASAGGLVVMTVAWIGWQLHHPFIGLDGYLYHLALAGAWAHDGHAGSIVDVVEGLPVANYPVTSEVGVSWALSLSHSWVWASVGTPLYGVLIAAGGWLGLRRARVQPAIAVLAITAFLVQPVVATQFGGPLTDVAAVGWLVATLGLCAAARDNARLLPVALLGAALSFGTKTTGAVVLLIALAWATWPHRAALRPMARVLALATAFGVVAGGLWVLRNLIDHGSPLWPFSATSFGDPVPATLKPFDDSFLSHPDTMLSGRLNGYFVTLAGATVLLVLPLAAVLISRARAVVALAGLSVFAVFVWSAAPYTGIDETALAVGATRYLLPAIVCCTLAGAVAASRSRGRPLVVLLLLVSIGLSAYRTKHLGFPYVPSPATVLGAFAAGAVLAALAGLRPLARAGRLLPQPLVAIVAALAVVVVLDGASDGFVQRHTDAGLGDSAVLRALTGVPVYTDTHVQVAMAPTTIALLRGDHLEHDLVMLPSRTPCPEVRQRATERVLILQRAPVTTAYRRLHACLAGITPVFEDSALQLYARAG